jgi:hypothetical protein
MKRFGKREPAFKIGFEPCPGHRMFLTPTTEGTQPTLAHLLPKTVKTGEISRDSVVVEVTLHHASQPPPKFCHGLVPASAKLLLQLFELCQEALPDGLA